MALLAFSLGLLLLAAVICGLRTLAAMPPKQVISLGRWGLAISGGLAVAGLALARQISLALGLALILWPLFRSVVPSFATWRAGASSPWGGSAGTGQTSRIETRFLAMELDHETGELDGIVRDGPHVGEFLHALGREQLLHLRRHYGDEDPPSQQVLDAYLDRRFPDWQQDREAGTASGSADAAVAAASAMTAAQAREILGVTADASEAEIREAYHRLIGMVHPDKGGPDFLAAQVNRAREILLPKASQNR